MKPKLPKRDQAVIAAHEAGMHDRKPRPDTCTLCAKDEQESAVPPKPLRLKPAAPPPPEYVPTWTAPEPVQGGPKVQTTRMLKCACEWCGYTVRTTRKWIDVTPPVCPVGDCEGFGHSMVVHEKEV